MSKFKIPESGFIEVSAEETEKRHRKKKSGKTKSRDTKKAEKTKSTKESSKGKRKSSQGPSTQIKIEEEVNKQETVDNLRKQSVLAGRVFDMGIINFPGMDSLHDMGEISRGCISSTKNLPFFMKRKCVNFTITFNFKKMEVSIPE